jgi:hypothetical protein
MSVTSRIELPTNWLTHSFARSTIALVVLLFSTLGVPSSFSQAVLSLSADSYVDAAAAATNFGGVKDWS